MLWGTTLPLTIRNGKATDHRNSLFRDTACVDLHSDCRMDMGDGSQIVWCNPCIAVDCSRLSVTGLCRDYWHTGVWPLMRHLSDSLYFESMPKPHPCQSS